MDHHSHEPMMPEATHDEVEAFRQRQQELLAQLTGQPLGATGKFPQGKISDNDEGELMFSVTTHRGQVIIDFGKPIAWAGLNPDQAMQLADALNRRAREAERQA